MIKRLLIFLLLLTLIKADANDACSTEGSHSDEWWFIPDLEWWEIIIGTIIVISALCVTFPQIIKLLRRRTSQGISPEYYLLVTLNSLLGFTNGTIFNYPYMQSCPYVGINVCLAALLSWLHVITMMFFEIIIFTLLVIFYENKQSIKFKKVLGYYFFYLCCLCTALTMVLLSIFYFGNCSVFSQTFARICGSSMIIIVLIKMFPQLYTTFKNKSSGSLSLLGNGFCVTFLLFNGLFNALVTGQDITTFISIICSCILESILMSMQIYFDYIRPFCKKYFSKNNNQYEKLEENEYI